MGWALSVELIHLELENWLGEVLERNDDRALSPLHDRAEKRKKNV